MKCYPIIYTRTDSCDYYANFHVIPEFVNANDVRPYILSATVGFDATVKRTKKLIFANDQYCVFGYVGFIKDIFEAESTNIQPYTRDNKGRAVYGFFGFAVQHTASDTIPILRTEDCHTAFAQYIMPVWKSNVPESVIPSSVTLEEMPHVFSDISPVAVHGNCHFYREEGELFETLLARWFTTKNAASYCSWIDDFAQIRNLLFTHVVTTDNAIFRLNNENSIAHTVPAPEVDVTNSPVKNSAPLSAAEEVQMMMREEEEAQSRLSEPTMDAEELTDVQADHEMLSHDPADYQHLYQSPEMSARVQVQASKKKDTVAKDTRIHQKSVYQQKGITSSERDELVKKTVIVAGAVAAAVAAAVGAGVAVKRVVKIRRKKRKQKNEQKEGKKNGK